MSSEIILHDGNIFDIDHMNLKNRGRVTTLIETLGSPNPGKIGGLLPPVIRYLDVKNGIFIWEKRPAWVNLKFKNASKNVPGTKSSYKIFIPWTVYECSTIKGYVMMGFRNEALESLKSPVYSPPLPNITNNKWLCTPKQTSFQETFKTAMGFWASEFNRNANPVPPPCTPPELMGKRWEETFEKWSKLSPKEVLKLEWRNPREPLNLDALERNYLYPSVLKVKVDTQNFLATALSVSKKRETNANKANP